MSERGSGGSLDVTTGVIWKQLVRLCLPVFFSSFFQQAYSLVNTYVIGRFASTTALGGIQATQSLVDLVVGFSVGMGTGCAIICGQQFGARQDERLGVSVRTAMTLALVGGIVLSALGLVFVRPMLELMGTPAELMGEALDFSRIYFGALVFSLVFNTGSAVQRSVGDTRTPSLIVAASCVVNVICDIIFIVFFHLEALGAGISTAISLFSGAAMTVWRLSRVEVPWRLDPRHLGIDPHTCSVMVKTGIPLGLQSSAYSISNIIIQSSVNSFGASTVTAWGLSGRIDGMVWMITEALGVSVTTFSAQNFGAHDYARVRRGLRSSLALTCLIVGLASGLVVAFAAPLSRFFVADQEICDISVYTIYFIAPFYVLFSCMDNISGTIRGCGESLRPMLITMVGTCLFRVVWLFTVVPAWHDLGTVLVVDPITWALTTVAFVIYYRHGHWLRHAEDHAAAALE